MTTLDLQVNLGGENPELLKGLREPIVDSRAYPVLVRALENVVPASWNKIEEGDFENWQQIFRVPFAYKFDDAEHFGSESSSAFDRLLASLEDTFVYGKPSSDITKRQGSCFPITTCGGTRHYLGRDIEPDDEIELRPLRMPVLRLLCGEFDAASDVYHHGEWLCETSLFVRAKEQQTDTIRTRFGFSHSALASSWYGESVLASEKARMLDVHIRKVADIRPLPNTVTATLSDNLGAPDSDGIEMEWVTEL